ncbi:HNH endonuclease [Sphingomonas azotifigens]|uniref:HNH endonuclease n=1 Tax=Sphingomonas azotifigens TaxID=330920 RepID=UPI001C3FF142|nr:HNH endonuclease signature motif containing protein [Sphingomonas azotifigens]
MKTKFGELSISDIMSAISDFRLLGEECFLKKYANGRGAKTTWISYEGDLYPANAIIRAAFFPVSLPKEFNTSDAHIFARELGLEIVTYADDFLNVNRSAIDDIDEFSGVEIPNRVPHSGERFVRDPKIRLQVLRRAAGKCEYCGAFGFKTKSGRIYLETHHIISLARQGCDSLANVIALCANDHRRAHFGDDWEHLEAEFKKKLIQLQDRK